MAGAVMGGLMRGDPHFDRHEERFSRADRERLEKVLRSFHHQFDGDEVRVQQLEYIEALQARYDAQKTQTPVDVVELRELVTRGLI